MIALRWPAALRRPAATTTRAATTAAALAATTALLSACSASTSTAPNVLMVSQGTCGTGWSHPQPGWQTLQIYNGSGTGAEADLINPATGAIYAEVEALGPGTTRPMHLDVGSGNYALRCVIEDNSALTGPVIHVGGHLRGTPGIEPVTDNDLLLPARQYHAYVTAGLKTLVTQTNALATSVKAGNLTAARKAWLPAHLSYERLGAAYGTFGRYDQEIDGRPDGLSQGVSDPAFTGFYRVEYGLWHGQSARELTGPASQLAASVSALNKAWPPMEVALLDIGLRTHEILENALQFQLTGHDDYGSGTTLATTQANITGTLELLSLLHPLLRPRYQALPAVYTWLSRLQSLLTAQHRNGTWTPVGQLTPAIREQIDAAASQALEELAPIAVITEPRRTQ